MPNLNNYREEKTFSVDATNIGNIDTKVESMFFSNIDTNINERDLKIDVNFNKDDEIKGSESKKIYITIKYNGPYREDAFYNFNVNYEFNDTL